MPGILLTRMLNQLGKVNAGTETAMHLIGEPAEIETVKCPEGTHCTLTVKIHAILQSALPTHGMITLLLLFETFFYTR